MFHHFISRLFQIVWWNHFHFHYKILIYYIYAPNYNYLMVLFTKSFYFDWESSPNETQLMLDSNIATMCFDLRQFFFSFGWWTEHINYSCHEACFGWAQNSLCSRLVQEQGPVFMLHHFKWSFFFFYKFIHFIHLSISQNSTVNVVGQKKFHYVLGTEPLMCFFLLFHDYYYYSLFRLRWKKDFPFIEAIGKLQYCQI